MKSEKWDFICFFNILAYSKSLNIITIGFFYTVIHSLGFENVNYVLEKNLGLELSIDSAHYGNLKLLYVFIEVELEKLYEKKVFSLTSEIYIWNFCISQRLTLYTFIYTAHAYT